MSLTERGSWARIKAAFLPESGPVAQLGARFHGMEEVVGSIPTRSTNFLNKLGAVSRQGKLVCVMVCVITGGFGAHSKHFHRCSLRFHSHVAVSLQHAMADVPGNCHDRRLRRTVLSEPRNSAVA